MALSTAIRSVCDSLFVVLNDPQLYFRFILLFPRALLRRVPWVSLSLVLRFLP
ncbi:hypothetical protein BDM02DRAFT_3110262 [Thelephora ganbajun]|uniref:Uncharacterized protein n=1 Tax=Thelephora ganbajun TaxID=370292 RepID=A0ACB6ZRP7_THEGA|nr:hypothetical protein BDM02DRAFT_3110262 [Thelephora ganbajun]